MTAAMEDELRPEDDAHRRWKQNAAPMYDWMTNHHLVWPALACRCALPAHLLCTREQAQTQSQCSRRFGEKRKSADDVAKYQQTIFYSEQVRSRLAGCSCSSSESSENLATSRRCGNVQVDKEEKTPNKLIMQTVNVHEVRDLQCTAALHPQRQSGACEP